MSMIATNGYDTYDHDIEILYEITVKDKDGNILEHVVKPSDTLVRNFWLGLGATLGPSFTVVNTNGTSVNIANFVNSNAPAGDSAYGIQIGSNDTPHNFTQYSLISLYAHSTSGFNYGALTINQPAYLDPPANSLYGIRFIRSFTNASASSQTVREIGLVLRGDTGSNFQNVLVIRDVITPVDVPSQGSITVQYVIRCQTF